MAKKKKFRMIDAILTVICVVFVAEAAAPAAAIGNSQFSWWIFLIITFLLPYGLVVAELGTAFDSEGGLYDWVRLGLGDRWGARCSWCYWVNFPLWVASIACMFPSVINAVWGIEVFAWGPKLPSSLPCVGRHGHGNAAGGRGRLGHGWRRRHQGAQLPPWWESSASGLPAIKALPTICRSRLSFQIWATPIH